MSVGWMGLNCGVVSGVVNLESPGWSTGQKTRLPRNPRVRSHQAIVAPMLSTISSIRSRPASASTFVCP
jgi:hypothetical protein